MFRQCRSLACSGSLVVAGLAMAGSPPEVRPQYELGATSASDYDVLGVSVAIDGGVMLAGGPGLDGPAGNTGGAIVFREQSPGWVASQVLIPSGAAAGDEFGSAVAVDGVRAAVGGPAADTAAGEDAGRVGVYLFNGSAWGESTVLSAGPGQGQLGAAFGSSLDLSGDVLAIGAPLHDTSIRDEGRVYVYRFQKTVWQLEAILEAPDAGENDRFGTSVSVSGDRIAVGVPRDDDRGIDGGAVWVFRREGGAWIADAKIVRDQSDWYAWFGGSVSLDGDRLAVGSYRDDLFGEDAGAVRVFGRDIDGWSLTSVLGASAAGIGAELGWSVALSGDRLTAGMPRAGVGGAAAVYQFGSGGWTEEASVLPWTGQGGYFGTGVSIASDRVVFGVPLASDRATYGGGVGVLDLTADCDEDGVPDILALASGAITDANGNGVPDVCECRGDLYVDGFVNGADLGVYLSFASGPCGPGTGNPNCVGDLNGDGVVSGADLGLLLGSWGPCK